MFLLFRYSPSTFHLQPSTRNFDLCRTEVTEHGEMCPVTQFALQLLRHPDATSLSVFGLLLLIPCTFSLHHNNINIVAGPLEEDITHIATYDIAVHTQAVCHVTYLVKDVLI